jgi:8-oxo-dGTP diphosphatase
LLNSNSMAPRTSHSFRHRRDLHPPAVTGSPRRLVAAGALFFNAENRLLVVKPNYRDGWLVPGGVVEADESPRQGCVREVQEELSLNCQIGRLLCLDYLSASPGRDEALKMTFLGGSLSSDQIAAIRLQEEEIETFEFVERAEALNRFIPKLKERIAYSFLALDENRTIYLENGIEGELS